MFTVPASTFSAACRRVAQTSSPLRGVALALGVAACASPTNHPSNLPLTDIVATTTSVPAQASNPTTAVILAFSGGGARAAAFGYGVLSALVEQPSRENATRSLADNVAVVAGVSGGGILAAHFALHGPEGLASFRRNFLDEDPEASLRTAYTPDNLLRAYRGGVNDLSGFAAWLDTRLYRGATLGDVDRNGRARLILHATDLYNRAPFSFDRASFMAICSDYDRFPLAHAVAASSAVPVAFSPVVLQNFSKTCPVATRAIRPSAPAFERSLFDTHVSESQARYASAKDLNYIKLLDGGLVDNLAARNLIRAMKQPAPEPLRAKTVPHLRRVIIIAVDASTRIGGDISNVSEGPSAPDAIVAATDAMIDAGSRMSFDALEDEAARWRNRLRRWRCGRGAPPSDCGKIDVSVARVSLSDVTDEVERTRILHLHYKLSLKPEDADFLVRLGSRELRRNPVFRSFIGSRP